MGISRVLAPYHPFFLEDPILSENPESYRLVREHVSLPITTGKHLVSKWEFRGLIEEDLINYARPALGVLGSLTEAKKLADWRETHYIDMSLYNPLGPVSTAACLAVSTGVPDFGMLELSWRPGEMSEGIEGAQA